MFWSMAGAVISRGLMLVASVFVARILGKTGFGELGIVRSTVDMFSVFAGFGLGLTATKHVAEFRRTDPERAGRIIALSAIFAVATGGLMAIGLFIFAPWLATHTIAAPHLAHPLRIAAVALFIGALNGAQTGTLAGFEAFRTIACVNLIVGVISFPILIVGAYFRGINGAIEAHVITLAVSWLLNHLMLRREARRYLVPIAWGHCLFERKILWMFSLPAVLTGALVGPVNWVCNAMLVNQPRGYEEMGILSAANQWYYLILFLPSLLGKVVLPVLSERLGQSQLRQTKRTLVFTLKMNMLFVLPPILLASAASPYVMGIYGENFRSGWPTLVTVIWTAGLISAQTPVAQVITASGKMWMGFLMNGGWAVLFIVSTALFVRFGAQGLASARAVSYLVHSVWVFGFAYWLLKRDAGANS